MFILFHNSSVCNVLVTFDIIDFVSCKKDSRDSISLMDYIYIFLVLKIISSIVVRKG